MVKWLKEWNGGILPAPAGNVVDLSIFFNLRISNKLKIPICREMKYQSKGTPY
jgi:hypothetical protein